MSAHTSQSLSPKLRRAMRDVHHLAEDACVTRVLKHADLSPDRSKRVSRRAERLIDYVRARGGGVLNFDGLLKEYELSTPEGVALMCLAEALLRIPDDATRDKLIQDKIVPGHWERHLGNGGSLFVNASTWALMLGGKVLDHDAAALPATGRGVVQGIAQRAGDTVLREAIAASMRVMGRHFVLGRTMSEAMARAEAQERKGYTYSYDRLGEAAMTADHAERHFEGYVDAIKVLRDASQGRDAAMLPEISVKLSALHPRYTPSQSARMRSELVPRLIDLARLAADAGLGLTIDAEESERLELSLDILDAVSRDRRLIGWHGLGVAVQTYQKRALDVVDWLEELAKRDKRRLRVRLVKGAYWDREIKRAQVLGLDGYPVFTRKESSDVSFLACAKRLRRACDRIYTAFATHNAHTVSAVMEMVGDLGRDDMEFQKLHGMGDALFDAVVGEGWPCRVYAPVGEHEELLPYLVRRLLENGANSSFVNRIADKEVSSSSLAADPVATLHAFEVKTHPRIPLPEDIYRAARDGQSSRRNAQGVDLDDEAVREPLLADMVLEAERHWVGGSIIGGHFVGGEVTAPVRAPFDTSLEIGTVHSATMEDAVRAFDVAAAAQDGWAEETAAHRANCLERAAELYEEHRAQLLAMVVNEGGKTLNDAVAEVREAVDFLRYYAERARHDCGPPTANPGPTGERNETRLAARGVFSCISPWNFPLAIFTGQVAAALAAGNAVVAKPAGATPIVAGLAVHLLHQAGVPRDVLNLIVGPSGELSSVLLGHKALGGVAFTGSVETAHDINRHLAQRPGAIVPLIAETGGENAMIVDSSALPEQVTRDVLTSAFHSAGQRCSALRVLFVQDDVAAKMVHMIAGAMDELKVGDPNDFANDIGPLIDQAAVGTMTAHAKRMTQAGSLVAKSPLPKGIAKQGHFFAPRAFEIDAIETVGGEVFGPILHIVRYKADKLDAVIDAINATGFGLTLGIHSRIDSTIERIRQRARVGNLYVNRSQIGAVVGVQPFGGEGLSGTGPKAGGPRYLHRFATERTLSVDTTASGGNATLMTLDDPKGQ